jgi:NADPH:quinone reductase-like Zn-dependent oxidoreductase
MRSDVLMVGEMPDPVPGAGEVRIRITASGVNPGDMVSMDRSALVECDTGDRDSDSVKNAVPEAVKASDCSQPRQ